VFHVIIAGVLLPKPRVFGITVVAATLVLVLAVGEYVGLFPHYTNVLFPHDSVGAHRHGADADHDENLPPAAAHVPARPADHAVEGESEHDADAEPADGHHATTAADEHGYEEGPEDPAHGLGEREGSGELHASHDPIFVAGRVLPFMGVLFLTGYLTTLAADRLYRSEMELERTARAALLEHRRLEGVVDTAGVGILLRGPDQTVRWASRRGTQWREHDTHGPGEPCPHGGVASGCPVCLVALTFATGESQETERRLRLDDGGVRYLRRATSPVRDRDGNVVQVVELVEDITARKALETQALHAGKLSVLGRMAAGVAHEIGNPLSSLTARLDLMERRDDPSFTRESLGVLRGQIGRIGRIVHGISHFARPRQQEWERWEINGVVAEALELLRGDRRAKRIEFRERLATPSPRVRGVRDQIVQVCLNLLLNAVEASPEGAVIDIETAQRGGEVVLTVSDQGEGVAPEVKAHLFEPFFTTKPEGTGLGLSISYSMVHAHDGRIEVRSDPGRGARFAVHLPAAEKGPPAA
jgi:signal transduction histidine kinase